ISGGTIIALYRPGLGPYGGTTNTQSGYDESNDGTIGLDSDPFDAEHGYTTTTVSGQPVIFAYGIQKTVNNGKGGHNRDGSNPGNGITVQPIHVLMTINDEHPTPASGGTIELKSFPIISNTDSLPSALEDANLNAYNLVIPSGATLHIPKGWTLIIDGGNDTKHNTLTNYGTIINDGAITVGSGTFYPDPGNFINRGILN
ncbi:MAG: hypothetical protein LBG27_06800, partial [Spirochaetaceae bacterium]|nr:hypothetical protein [Spirochaetaceae bacterium]